MKENMILQEGLSRRGFIQSAAVVAGVAGVAVAGLAGCTTNAPAAADEEPLDVEKIAWDTEVDILVAGSGAAGMSATVAASASGASTICIDCNDEIGGSCVLMQGSMGFYGPNPWFDEQDFHPTKEEYFEKLIDPTDREAKRNDPELVRAFLDCFETEYEFLSSNGVNFIYGRANKEAVSGNLTIGAFEENPGPGFMFNLTPSGDPCSGSGYIYPMEIAAKQNGAEFLVKHKLVGLVREDSGRVIGAKVDNAGTIKYFKANKAVILCAGSWKGGRFLRRLWDPRFTDEIVGTAEPFATCDGSAIIAGLEIGASMCTDNAVDWHLFHRMFGTPYYRFPAGSPYAAPGIPITTQTMRDVICVNKAGVRFVNEILPETGDGFYNWALITEDRIIWTIYDDDAAQKNDGWADVAVPTITEGMGFKADTIAEIANLTKLPATALENTISEFNASVDAGEDPLCGRPADSLVSKIAKPPFYALKTSIQIHDSCGGLTIDGNCSCIDIYGKVIPGLYATGENAGGLNLIGTPKGIIQGRIAALHAVK